MKNRISSNATDPKKNDGFILVAVLWVLGALSALVSIYAAYVIATASGLAGYDDRLRAQALVIAASELTAHHQLMMPAQSRSATGQFGFHLGTGQVAVSYQSEAARIDLNRAPKDLLAGLFATLGARPDQADAYGARVIDWRTPSASSHADEALAYRKAGLGYMPRGAAFPATSELALVRDLPKALVERALPYVTIFSGRPQINILAAEPAVLLAIPGMTRENANALVKQRSLSPHNGQALMQLMGDAQKYATLEAGKTFRLAVEVAFDQGGHASYEVVIQIFEEGDEPLAILSWRDTIDEPTQGSMR